MAQFKQSATLSVDSRYSIELTVTENIPSDYISTNKTNVTYTLTATKSSGYGYYDNSPRNNVSVWINGSNVYNQNITYDFTGSTPKTITLASGYVNGITHNNDGTKTIGVSGSFNDPTGDIGSATVSGNLTLTNIPRQANVTNATDFNDEENPTIQFSNPGGFRINARLEFGGTSIRRDNIPNTGSYTFELTNEERELLRSKTPNSNTLGVREVIATCIGGTTETNWSWQDKKMTIINGNPVFSDFDFEDINTTTLALTGNNKYNINGFSTIRATVSVQNKAEAVKGATITRYRLVVGNKTETATYSASEDVVIEMKNAPDGNYTLYADDSRGNSKQVNKFSLQSIEYEPIYIDRNNSYPYRDSNGKGANGYLRYKGTMWNGDFGEEVNEIVSAIYQFKKTTSNEWITGTTNIIPTLTENEFNFNNLVRSDNSDYKFDLDASYNFKIRIEDKLSIYELELTPMASSIPNISINRNGVGIMCDYDTSIGGLLQVGGKVVGEDKFSSMEIKTNKVWIDNKPIYRKYFSYNHSSTGDYTYTHNLNIDTLVNVVAFGTVASQTISSHGFRIIPFSNFSGYSFYINNIKKNTITTTSLGWTGNTIYIYLEYTKSD